MSPAPSPRPTAHPPHARWLWPFMLGLGTVTMVVAWASLALATDRQHGWVALLAGLEAAWMLRLGGMAAGRARSLLAALATVAMIVAVQWFVAAGHIGGQMGMAPWEAAPKMGAWHVMTLSLMANTRLDLVLLALGPLLAWRAGR